MPLPNTFGGLPGPVPLGALDQNFAALGALAAIPCVIAGTSALTLTPAANTPTIAQYVDYQPFTGIAVAINTGPVTAQVGGLAALQVYKDSPSGPAVLTGGEIVTLNFITLVYDAALNTGGGGFHLTAGVDTAILSVSGTPTSGQIAKWVSASELEGIAVTGGGSVVLATAPTLIAPNLGTPTALTLTSATGLPASGGLAGLGTGVATALGQNAVGSGGIALALTPVLTTPRTVGYATSALPAAGAGLLGARAYVTDASTATPPYGSVVTSGGSATVPVFCNGSAWIYG